MYIEGLQVREQLRLARHIPRLQQGVALKNADHLPVGRKPAVGGGRSLTSAPEVIPIVHQPDLQLFQICFEEHSILSR